jgi:hypothetical protein
MPTLNAGTVVALSLSAGIALALGTFVSGPPRALAHSWYPVRCCSGQDCRKVDRIETLPDGDAVFHAGSISVVVAAEFLRLPSEDNDTHICVYRVGSGEYRPRCIFVPGSS